jgi:hypothetical protein
MTVTAEQLRADEIAYQRIKAKYDEIRERRNQLIRQAASEGWTDQRIASTLGTITRARAGKIAQHGRTTTIGKDA